MPGTKYDLYVRYELDEKIRHFNYSYSLLDNKSKLMYLMSMADKDTWPWLGIALVKMYRILLKEN